MERTRVLYAVAVILLLAGLLLRIAPPRVGAGLALSDPAGAPPLDRKAMPRDTAGTYAAIIGGNIFSISRSAPKYRYTPPDLATSGQPVRTAARPAAANLRLFGTVSGTAALIDADPAGRGAEIYQIGDVVRGKRITAVSESTVVLEGSAGRSVLRLPPSQPTP